MPHIFFYALISVSFVSLLSLMGAFLLLFSRKTLERLTKYSLAVSSGILLGTTFYDLLPESYERISVDAFTWLLIGFIVFFVFEKILHWHHHVEGEDCPQKPVAYLTLVGDSIHNFLDGAVIGVAFLTNIPLGVTTTLAVIAHEIPHELGDFSILMYAGFSSKKALWYNFLSALTAIAGTLTIFVFASGITSLSPYMVAFAAGNFLYIGASDLIPELHQKQSIHASITQILIFIFAIISIGYLVRLLHV